jgi:hypothetical protein
MQPYVGHVKASTPEKAVNVAVLNTAHISPLSVVEVFEGTHWGALDNREVL